MLDPTTRRTTCDTDGCSATTVAAGLCARHYRWRRDGRVVCAIDGCAKVALAGQLLCRGHTAAGRPCAANGCGQAVKARRLCSHHYKQQRHPPGARAGDLVDWAATMYPDRARQRLASEARQ